MTAIKSPGNADDSSSAYLRDVVYASQYNPLLNPLNIHYIAAMKGLVCGPMKTAFQFLDLGCGDGTTLSMLASMYPDAQFTGIDFNEDHIRLARETACQMELKNVEFQRMDFLDLDKLLHEKFDFITCFGTYSWISGAARESIAAFAGASLKPGGYFLVHYTASPGKVQIDPFWYLMRIAGGEGAAASIERTSRGIGVIKALHQCGAKFFKENPLASELVNQLDRRTLTHWAHTGLTTEWQALRHGDVSDRMKKAGLAFLGHANPEQNHEDLSVPGEFHSLLSTVTDTKIRQTIIDYILNRGARVDLYIRRAAVPASAEPTIGDIPFGIATVDNAIVQAYKCMNGIQLQYDEPMYKAVIGELLKGARTPNNLHAAKSLSGYAPKSINEAVSRLVVGKKVQPFAKCSDLKGLIQPSRIMPANRQIAAVFSSQLALGRTVCVPNMASGQCVDLLPHHALVLSGMLRYPPEGVVDWVIGQLQAADVLRDRVTNELADPMQVRNSVLGHVNVVNVAILPNLLRLGLLVPG